MELVELSLDEFAAKAASKDAVPGGGGVAAYVGALGAALAQMTCNLTIGKPKYAEHEADLRECAAELEKARVRLMALVDEDATAFEPLSHAYSIPKDDPLREPLMEAGLREAARVPFECLELASTCMGHIDTAARYGSKLVISDAGCAAACCRAAAQAAMLNVRANTRLMKDRAYADELEEHAVGLLDMSLGYADDIYASVLAQLS